MGKKYIDNYVFNAMNLKQILYKIKIEKDESYYYELLNDKDVIRLINQFTNKYSYGQGSFFINRDTIKGLVQQEICLITWKELKFWLLPQDEPENTINGYLAFLYQRVPHRVRKVIQNERPNKTSPSKDSPRYWEDGWDNLTPDDPRYFVTILSGNINDLINIKEYYDE
jgi:hypothetical protein